MDGESWNQLFEDIHAWRVELRERYAIPLSRELHACDLLAGRGLLAKNGTNSERVSVEQGAQVFLEGLRRLEDAAGRIGGIEVINVCLHKPGEQEVRAGQPGQAPQPYQHLGHLSQ